MVSLEENIRKYAEEFLKDSEYFLVDVVVGTSAKKVKFSVFIDADTSVAVEKCAQLSRFITGKIEEDLAFEEAYVIEVSSAGIDKPLTLERQYHKNKGRNVEIVETNGIKHIGKLVEVNTKIIRISTPATKKTPEKEVELNFNNIKSTKVVISF
jgi:ribosome maturation factor RimP